MAAAKVGGILANDTYPADFISDNLRMQVNVLDAAARHGTSRAPVPGIELHLSQAGPATDLGGQPAHWSPRADERGLRDRQDRRRAPGSGPATAVRSPLHLRDADEPLRPRRQLPSEQLTRSACSDPALPRSGGGRTRHPSPSGGRVRLDESSSTSTIWRGRACSCSSSYDEPHPINVGAGKDLSIRELAETIADIVGYEGLIEFDSSFPDGTPRKLLDVRKINDLGWHAEIGFRDGLRQTYAWYLEQLRTGTVRAA